MAHDDIMILDTGDQVFLWMGPRCSEVEVKLSYKSAQVYIQNLRAKQPEKPRKLFLTIMVCYWIANLRSDVVFM